jgi:hypothetical protein
MLLILEKLLNPHYHSEIQIPFSAAITRFGAFVSMFLPQRIIGELPNYFFDAVG